MKDKALKNFLRDREEVVRYSSERDEKSIEKFKRILMEIKEERDTKIVADYTEYNPLHLGHKYCLRRGKEEGLFISVLPGPLERSGRGVPYLVDRYIRAEMAIRAGADIVVEGPPLGIMGSGQYMECIVKMFHTLGVEVIPRGYIKNPSMERIIELINKGYHIKVKPYRISCIETGEFICEKLEIDNYIIASLSYTMYKLNRRYGLNFHPRFLFVERLEGISGSKIREYIYSGRFQEIRDMVPETTLEVLEEYSGGDIEGIILKRFEDRILETANEYPLERYVPRHIAEVLERNRPYRSLEEIREAIPQGFSRHLRERILSRLECRIESDVISNYIRNYPSKIRILAINKSIRDIL
ncbi:nucleotidyltransferase family protein [Methanothermococcus sp. SCGC AD-155-E23]|nr:nucleotidyltransferase family protein [Methanothermococcus sp. SCGC AD-155-E23]